MISTIEYGSFVVGLITYLSTNTVATKKVNTKNPNIRQRMTPKNVEVKLFALCAISLVMIAFS